MPASPQRRARTRAVLTGRVSQLRAERAAEGHPVTYRELAASLGVSESTLYKTRKGTRSGSKVYQRIVATPRFDREAYQIVIETQDKHGGVLTQSVNVAVTDRELRAAGIKRRAFSGPRVATNSETQNLVRKTLIKRAYENRRSKKGTKPWTRAQIGSAEIVSVRRPKKTTVIPKELKLSIPFPQIRGQDIANEPLADEER